MTLVYTSASNRVGKDLHPDDAAEEFSLQPTQAEGRAAKQRRLSRRCPLVSDYHPVNISDPGDALSTGCVYGSGRASDIIYTTAVSPSTDQIRAG